MGGAYPGDAYRNVLFENPGFGNHWITVRLVGVDSNRSASARASASTSSRTACAARSTAPWTPAAASAATRLRHEIGLGAATKIETLEVHWPTSDTRQVLRDVAADQAIEITEGKDGYRSLAYPRVTLAPASDGRPLPLLADASRNGSGAPPKRQDQSIQQ